MLIDPRLPEPSMGELVVMSAEHELIDAQYNLDQRIPRLLVIVAGTTEFITQETGDVDFDATFDIPTNITSETTPAHPLPDIVTSKAEVALPLSSGLSGAMAVVGVAWWARNKFRRDKAHNNVGKQ